MVQAEDLAPSIEQLFADGSATGAVSFGLQVADGVQDKLPASGGAVSQRGGGEHVRGQLGVAGPASTAASKVRPEQPTMGHAAQLVPSAPG
jgi:hypothetical protein